MGDGHAYGRLTSLYSGSKDVGYNTMSLPLLFVAYNDTVQEFFLSPTTVADFGQTIFDWAKTALQFRRHHTAQSFRRYEKRTSDLCGVGWILLDCLVMISAVNKVSPDSQVNHCRGRKPARLELGSDRRGRHGLPTFVKVWLTIERNPTFWITLVAVHHPVERVTMIVVDTRDAHQHIWVLWYWHRDTSHRLYTITTIPCRVR